MFHIGVEHPFGHTRRWRLTLYLPWCGSLPTADVLAAAAAMTAAAAAVSIDVALTTKNVSTDTTVVRSPPTTESAFAFAAPVSLNISLVIDADRSSHINVLRTS